MRTRNDHPYVLVVGATHPENAGCIGALTESNNYLFAEARTADDAIEMAGRRRPSIILLNLDGREHAGLEICRALVNSDTTRNIPILAVAGEPSDRQFMISLNVQECDADALEAEIRRIVQTVH